MESDEFEALMDGYITRSAERDDALPAPTFLELLFALLERRASNVGQVEGEIIDGELVPKPNRRSSASAGARQSYSAGRSGSPGQSEGQCAATSVESVMHFWP
jgi:hypothetical protein